MIYIYDDRNQRRKDNEEKLRCFSDLITFGTVTLTSGKSVEESIIDSIENPDCIIFHKSYALGDDSITFETILQIFSSYEVPVVVFSGGIEGSNKNDLKILMNADQMYDNLPYFLENYRNERQINIDTLLWGKRHELNKLLEFQNKMSATYLINNDPDDPIDDLAEVKRKVSQAARKISVGFCTSIVSDIDSHPSISWLDLANIIEKNIQKFK